MCVCLLVSPHGSLVSRPISSFSILHTVKQEPGDEASCVVGANRLTTCMYVHCTMIYTSGQGEGKTPTIPYKGIGVLCYTIELDIVLINIENSGDSTMTL